MAKKLPEQISTSGFFEDMFEHARQNSIVLMQTDGTVIGFNAAFEINFGYEDADLVGKNHRVLFTEKDRMRMRPETELESVLAENQGSDDCYLVHKDGTHVWVN